MTRPIAPGPHTIPPPISQTSPTNGANLPTPPQHDPAMVKAAQGMEAMFLNYLFQVMRKGIPENALSMESGATKIYRGMMDFEAAQTAAKNGGVGLADQIIAYLESNQYNKNRKPVPQQHPYRRYR